MNYKHAAKFSTFPLTHFQKLADYQAVICVNDKWFRQSNSLGTKCHSFQTILMHAGPCGHNMRVANLMLLSLQNNARELISDSLGCRQPEHRNIGMERIKLCAMQPLIAESCRNQSIRDEYIQFRID